MIRWFFLVLSLLLLAFSSLTAIKSPDWAPWKAALLAGEFGHWLALVSLALAAVAWLSRDRLFAVCLATTLVSAVAFGLFLQPCLRAWLIGQTLPEKFAAQFDPAAAPPRAPFSLKGLLSFSDYAWQHETLRYTGELDLDFYRPAQRFFPGPRPCVIVVHGGGWDGGTRGELAHFNGWLAFRGYAVAAIDYRLAPKSPWPAPRDDILAAVAYLKTNAAKLGLDPARFVLFGRSAGGNLAEATAYAAHDPAVRGVIALYAPADMHFAYQYSREDDILKSPLLLRQFLGGTPDAARSAYDAASGYLQVEKSTPPTLLLHGELDTLVWHRQSVRLDARLSEAGVPHAFVSLPWATHAFEYNLHGPGGQLTTYAVAWFLASVTK